MSLFDDSSDPDPGPRRPAPMGPHPAPRLVGRPQPWHPWGSAEECITSLRSELSNARLAMRELEKAAQERYAFGRHEGWLRALTWAAERLRAQKLTTLADEIINGAYRP